MNNSESYATDRYSELYEVTGRLLSGEHFRYIENATNSAEAIYQVLEDRFHNAANVATIDAEPVN